MAKGKKSTKKASQKAKFNEVPETAETGMKSFGSTLIILIVTIIIALIIASISSSVDKTKQKPESYDPKDFIFELPTTKIYELTNVDLFSLENWNSYDVTVKGVALGDTLDQVEQILGDPDDVQIYNPVVSTLVYKENGKDALLFYIANKQVRRIIIRPGFNDHLIGKTKIDYELRAIYDEFGIPDEQEDVSKQRIFEYHSKGLEVYNRNKQMTAFALVPPGYDGGQDEERPLSDFA